MAEEEEKGVYVGSGGFRVDRARMLERLSRYGYENSHYALIGLVRCAVLGKASRVTMVGLAGDGFSFKYHDGLEIRFDGEPFDQDALACPYDCLFSDGPGHARGAQLARALLTLCAQRPRELTVTSGPKGARFELSVRSPSEESVRPVDGDGPTVVRASWESFSGEPPELLLGLARMVQERFRHCPIPVELAHVWLGQGDGKSRHDFTMRADGPDAAVNATFERDGMRGRVELPMRIAPATGHIELSWAGAQVEIIRDASFLPVPADGFVEHAGFALDLSAGAVVRDEAYFAALAALSLEAAALAGRTAREHHARMKDVSARLKGAAARETWTDTLNGQVANEPEASWWDRRWSPEEALEERRKVFRAAATTRWLRHCALKVADAATAPPELASALEETPLYFSTAGEPLSLKQLKTIFERLGRIPATARFGAAGPDPGPVLWLSSSRDAALLPPRLTIKRLAQ